MRPVRVGKRSACQNVTFAIVLPSDPRRSCPCLFPPGLPKPTAGPATLFFPLPPVKSPVAVGCQFTSHLSVQLLSPPPSPSPATAEVVNSWRVVSESISFCVVCTSGPRADDVMICLVLLLDDSAIGIKLWQLNAVFKKMYRIKIAWFQASAAM
jgi:hypothetical protein